MSPRTRRRLAPAAGLLVLALVVLALPGRPAGIDAAAAGALADVSTIAVVGDFGLNNTAEGQVAALIAGWSPDAVLALGDDYYNIAGGTGVGRYDLSVGKYYCRFLRGAAVGTNCLSGGTADVNRFWSSTGNHDYSDGGGATPLANYLAYFAFPGNERYYSVRLGAAEVFVLDSDEALRNATDMSAQKAWLETALKGSAAPWQIVIFHHPPYSSGSTHGSSLAMRWPFASWGADLVLSGHDHTYERVAADGITYVVNGLGGASRYTFGTPVAGSLVRYAANYGALKLRATDSSLTGSFISVGGTLVDTFTIGGTTSATFRDGASPSATYAGTRDTTLSQSQSSTVRGAETTLYVDADDPAGSGQDHVALLGWDVSSIPTSATVLGASLEYSVANTSTGAYPIYEVLRAWDEGAATWTKATSGVVWASPGAAGATDRGGTALGTLAAGSLGAGSSTLNAAGVALVQAWVAGTKPNHGLVIADASIADGADLASAEAATLSTRPALVVRYTTGAASPTPPASWSWSGGTWKVRTSASPVGPGPNVFAAANVWVDGDGYLHLRVAKDDTGTWTSAGVGGPTSHGYGTYTFTLGSRVDALDPSVVLGLFTWSDDPLYANREIDIEFARWGDASNPTNGQYAVPPYNPEIHLFRFTQGALSPTTQSFTWAPGQIDWESRDGSGAIIASKTYAGSDVPVPGDERPSLNLWLYGGVAPTDGLPAEVIIRSFTFSASPGPTPSPSATPTPTPTPAPVPAPFGKTAPKNAAKVVAGTISLSWAPSIGATGYQYCLSTSSTCSPSSWLSVATPTSVDVTVGTRSVTRWWQVRASNGAGTTLANAGTVWKFTTK